MTASVRFFCSESEETDILRYLMGADDTRAFDVADGSLDDSKHFNIDDMPKPDVVVSLYIWRPAYGPLVWHTSQPSSVGVTHGSFVQNVLAGEEWRKRRLVDGDRMLDADLSPILHYERGDSRSGRTAPSELVAPPSSLCRAGEMYERWCKRSFAWIRRKGVIVHDYRHPSNKLANPDMILNTVYAFPDAKRILDEDSSRFVISHSNIA